MLLLIPLLILKLLSLPICAASQVMRLNPDKRLRAAISKDSMNRLAVSGDRITNIYGDSEAYEVQAEESTGQLFLKPTLENGKKPLAITLITENGLTQDMSLEPVERDAATVILKNPPTSYLVDAPSGSGVNQEPGFRNQLSDRTSQVWMGHGSNDHPQSLTQLPTQLPGFGATHTFQDQVIQAMKYLVSGTAPIIEGDTSLQRRSPPCITINLIEMSNLGNFKGYKLDVKNTGEVAVDILEKDFYLSQDLALSFAKRVLAPHTSTVLYVISRS